MKKLIFCVITFLLLFSSTVHAQGISSLSVRTTYGKDAAVIDIKTKAGAEHTFNFKVSNVTGDSVNYDIYPSDVITQIGGGWGYNLPTVKNTNVGTWWEEGIKTSFDVKPRMENTHSFKVIIPKDTSPGVYISGIAVLEQQQKQTTLDVEGTPNSIAAQQTISTINAIQVILRIDEDKAKHLLELSEPTLFSDRGMQYIHIPIVNSGTTYERPYGDMVLTREGGSDPISTLSYNMESIYANTVGIYPFKLPELEPGQYVLDYTSTYQDKTLKGRFTFGITQKDVNNLINDKIDSGLIIEKTDKTIIWLLWIAIIIILLLLICIFWFLILLKRKKKKEKKEEPEQLEDVGKNDQEENKDEDKESHT